MAISGEKAMVLTKKRISDDEILAIKSRVDLLSLVESDLGAGRKSGQFVFFRCPFHEDRTPSFAVYPDGHWYCFGACARAGDVYDYVMKREGLSFPDAYRWLGGAVEEQKFSLPAPRSTQEPDFGPPRYEWQEAAFNVAYDALDRLFTGEGEAVDRARAYLCEDRGLDEATWSGAMLGFIPGRGWQREGELLIPQGITIPWVYDGNVWKVAVRRPTNDPRQKYRRIEGGSAGGVYMPGGFKPGKPLLVAEGEFNALTALQEVGDLVNVLSIGGASKHIHADLYGLLAQAPVVIAAYDVDRRSRTGQKAAARLMQLSARVRRLVLPLPAGANSVDLNSFHVAGGDLRALVEEVLA
jgi:DNA primase